MLLDIKALIGGNGLATQKLMSVLFEVDVRTIN